MRRAIDGSASLPTLAAAMVACERDRLPQEDEEKTDMNDTTTREQRPPLWATVALTTSLTVTVPQWLADEKFPGGVAASLEQKEDGTVFLALKASAQSSAHFGRVRDTGRRGPVKALQIKPTNIERFPGTAEDLHFGSVEPSGMVEQDHSVILRIAADRLRAPLDRPRRKKAEVEPKSPAEALAIKDLVKAINAHVGVDDGLQLSVDPTSGKLKATIMVEFE